MLFRLERFRALDGAGQIIRGNSRGEMLVVTEDDEIRTDFENGLEVIIGISEENRSSGKCGLNSLHTLLFVLFRTLSFDQRHRRITGDNNE